MLAKGREKSLLRRHPWIFSGAVARMEGKASLGETIDIVDHQGKMVSTRRLFASFANPGARLDV
ncbi:putative oxidoreductase [Escherichia coli]|nr:putative oxidoreductase [Escherichia coli]